MQKVIFNICVFFTMCVILSGISYYSVSLAIGIVILMIVLFGLSIYIKKVNDKKKNKRIDVYPHLFFANNEKLKEIKYD